MEKSILSAPGFFEVSFIYFKGSSNIHAFSYRALFMISKFFHIVQKKYVTEIVAVMGILLS